MDVDIVFMVHLLKPEHTRSIPDFEELKPKKINRLRYEIIKSNLPDGNLVNQGFKSIQHSTAMVNRFKVFS